LIFIFHPSDRCRCCRFVDVVGVLSVFVFFFFFFFFSKSVIFSPDLKENPKKRFSFLLIANCEGVRRRGKIGKYLSLKKKRAGGGCEGTSFSSLFSKKRGPDSLILVLGSKFDFFLFSLFLDSIVGKNDGVVKPNHVFLCSYFS